MQRIAGNNVYGTQPPSRSPANTPGYFGPGVPAAGQRSTQVTYEWANNVQEELVSAIIAAGINLNVQDHSQLLQAIRNLGGEAVWNNRQNYTSPALKFGSDGKVYIWQKASGPAISGVGPQDPTVAGSATYWLDYAASITPPPASPYELCTTVYSRLCVVSRPGFVPVNGTLVANAVNRYPAAWAYLQTVEGQQMCVTEVEWQALVRATWHTNADGTKIGWNGIGGAAKYVIDLNAGTIRTPDLRGMTDEVDGYGPLGVGGVRGDQIRNFAGQFTSVTPVTQTGPFVAQTAYNGNIHLSEYSYNNRNAWLFDPSRVVPTGPRNHGPRYISDARVYLGLPAS